MHHGAFYIKARLCNLTAAQRLHSLICMIEPQILAVHFHLSEITDYVSTLEAVFDKLYKWNCPTTLECLLRQWRSLRIS